jgi:hypothetical protein
LKALIGRTIVARGKCESASAPPRVKRQKHKPLIAKPRDSANLIYGIFSANADRTQMMFMVRENLANENITGS